MRYLISSLVALIVLACASTNTGSPRSYNTLEVLNNSGHVIQVFIDNGGTRPLRRVYPGRECIMLPSVLNDNLRFGVRHIGERVEWMRGYLQTPTNSGWVMEINQSQQIVFDLNRVVPSERCQHSP